MKIDIQNIKNLYSKAVRLSNERVFELTKLLQAAQEHNDKLKNFYNRLDQADEDQAELTMSDDGCLLINGEPLP